MAVTLPSRAVAVSLADLGVEAADARAVGVADGGDDEAAVGLGGDADVDAVEVVVVLDEIQAIPGVLGSRTFLVFEDQDNR